MDKYYTLMIVPEKNKNVKSFRIPGLFFRAMTFIFVLTSILIGILAYDYWNILRQVYENKHLNMENRQLREQIQLFQMKVNSLSDDLQRINTFEKKLRIITGLEDVTKKEPLVKDEDNDPIDSKSNQKKGNPFLKNKQSLHKTQNSLIQKSLVFSDIEEKEDFIELKGLYDKKIAANLGINQNYTISRKWSDLTRKSFELSNQFAQFDYKFNHIKSAINELELKVHELDQYLLDKNSILRSTPTLLPSNGWITSYFGIRISPHSKGLKMHEGLDVGAPFGTPIIAPADGVITFSGIKPGFGKFVQIDHGYGIETIYAHAQKTLVKSGQKVKRGHLIAKVGSTGYSTGPHLHYEVRVNGIAVDPLYFILEQ